MGTSKCRSCKTIKATGDVCPGCGSGMMPATLRVRKGQPYSVFGKHGLHQAAYGVARSTADGHYI